MKKAFDRLFGGVPFEEILLCAAAQRRKSKKVKKPKIVYHCFVCKKKCNKRFMFNHSYSRVGQGAWYYACSKKHMQEASDSLPTEDKDAQRWHYSEYPGE